MADLHAGACIPVDAGAMLAGPGTHQHWTRGSSTNLPWTSIAQ
ncbi:hypothetical protein ACIPUC_13120 [Streptomyces sp. LARHCF249]